MAPLRWVQAYSTRAASSTPARLSAENAASETSASLGSHFAEDVARGLAAPRQRRGD